jgi:large subunit ribosomal protein L9
MQVILMKEVLGLGDPGEIVKVKNGYGRNYLVPQGMAIEATKKNISLVEAEQKRIKADLIREAASMRSDAEKLEGVVIDVLAKAGEGGKLYGSVTNMVLAEKLLEQGHEIDRRRIIMDAPIKSVGSHQVKVKLHPQVSVMITVNVEGELDQKALEAQAAAEAQAKAAEEAAAQAEEAGSEEPDKEAAESEEQSAEETQAE